jgi:tetratricopeptide (TPR) repeat protein
MGRYDEALQALGQAAEKYRRANDVEAQARVAAQIGRVHADRGTSDEGIAYTGRMLEALEGGDPSPGMAALYAALAFLYFAAGRYREQQAAAERASELARRFGNDEILAAAEVRRASALLMLGQREQALAVLQDAIPLADRVGDLVSLHRALAAISEFYRAGGQFEESKLYRERSLEVANRLGAPATIAFALAALGRVSFFQGAWEEARTYCERALTIAASTSSWFAAYPSHHFGELRLAQGAWDEAARHLETAATIGRRNNDMQALRMAHQALAELDLLHGRPDAARARLEPLLDRPGLTEDQATALLPILAQAELEAGNPERAESVLAETMSRAAAQNARLATLDALRVRGVLFSRQRRWTDARHTFEQATAMAHAMSYPYAEARTLYELGLMHGETDAPQQARECLEEALAIFGRLGAQPYIERTEQALAELQ